MPDVALTGKCTRECDEFGHSDTCWMPVRSSPRRPRHGSDPPRLSTFAPGDDNNNLRGNNHHESDSESSAGSSEPGVVVSAEGQRLPLANGDPLGTLGNRNMGDHNRNLLNRKMTSASYDTFSSAGFGRRQPGDEEAGESQEAPEVIPLTRTGGDYKTTSCLTLSRREVYL